jgi:hypothetical protein
MTGGGPMPDDITTITWLDDRARVVDLEIPI